MAVFTCPLEYILSVRELFWNFFFSADPKKTLSFLFRTLVSTTLGTYMSVAFIKEENLNDTKVSEVTNNTVM